MALEDKPRTNSYCSEFRGSQLVIQFVRSAALRTVMSHHKFALFCHCHCSLVYSINTLSQDLHGTNLLCQCSISCLATHQIYLCNFTQRWYTCVRIYTCTTMLFEHMIPKLIPCHTDHMCYLKIYPNTIPRCPHSVTPS